MMTVPQVDDSAQPTVNEQAGCTHDLPTTVAARTAAVVRLVLTDFRCYDRLTLDCSPRSVVLTGPNGAGKTNILEALSFLIPGRGLRRARLTDIARQKVNLPQGMEMADPKGGWGVAATIENPEGEFKVGTGCESDGIGGTTERRVVRIDGEPVKNQGELGRLLTAIWLTPTMDRLFRGGSGPRRRFMDRLVYAFDPEHASRTAAYEHALKNWTRLLREGCRDKTWLSALEETLATQGIAVAAARREIIARLSRFLNEYEGPFPAGELFVEGAAEKFLDDMPAIAAEDALKDEFEKARANHYGGQVSAEGPHRSDLRVTHRDRGLSAELCSTGEQKALLISIILAQARSQALAHGVAPVLLLDEVAAHLDEGRRSALFDEIAALKTQAWMTGTEPETFAKLKDSAQMVQLQHAQVVSTN